MKSLIASVAFLVSITSMTSPTQAQIRVGPFGGVSVRVPFVSVDVLPYGIPFGGGAYQHYGYPIFPGDVYVARRPLYAYPPYPLFYGDYLDHPAYSYSGEPFHLVEPGTPINPGNPVTRAEAARSSFGEIRTFDSLYSGPDALMGAAQTLQRSLSSRGHDGDIWLDYLKPDQIRDTVRTGGDANPLVVLLRHYDGVVGNSDLVEIAHVPGFRRTHQGLKVWVQRNANSGTSAAAHSGIPALEPSPAQIPQPEPDMASDEI